MPTSGASAVRPTRRAAVLFISFVFIQSAFFAVASPAPVRAADPNPIVAENALPGTPASEWDVSGAGDPSIQGFGTDISVDRGQTIDFKIDTTAASYDLRIYRLGYYGGNGARLVATIPAVTGTNQPDCTLSPILMGGGATTSGQLLDCGNWSVSASWAVPADAASGVYIARPTRTDNGGASHIPFIVRDDTSTSDLIFQTSDTTWQSYNVYGGYNAYGSSGATMAEKLSYNRPFTTRGAELENYLFNAEYPMIRWLERNGYDVSYMSAVDTERHANLIANHKVFLSVGHDEYWSQGRRDAVTAARDQGVNLAFISANEIYWKTRWEASTADGGSPDYRTQVVYKEGTTAPSGSVEHRNCYDNYDCDPSGIWTGQWREAPSATPENSLSGQISWRLNEEPITVPGDYAGMRFWRNTDVAALSPGASVTLADNTLGYEWDPEYAEYADFYPAGRVWLSTTDIGDTFAGPSTHHLSFYRAPSGALVFGAGTVQWAWGLDSHHDRGSAPEDPNMQQATVNLFADMGVQPATIQTNLVATAASADVTPPTVNVTAPASGASVPGGAVTITGTASDVDGVVAGVEISTDGGAHWRRATGRDAWSYTYAAADGTADIRVRAVDDSARLSVPISHSFTVEPRDCSTGCTIWTTDPLGVSTGNDSAQPIEVGTKFRTAESGLITSIRIFKPTAATWNLRGRLRLPDGTVLGESADLAVSGIGWMDLPLSAPVPVEAGTTYVASYFSSSGDYSYTNSYFAAAFDNPPLRALAGGEDGANGVYRYGAITSLPLDQAFQSASYWADLTFINELPVHTFFDNAALPADWTADVNDGQAIELGMRFRTTVPGEVTALRFYKAPSASGTMTASLWTEGGTLLASGSIDAVADTGGWREVPLDTPVPLTVGTNYVVSYFSPSPGWFVMSQPGAFATDLVVGPLVAPADTEAAPNGVYKYGGGFPNAASYRSYYLDVVVRETLPPDTNAPTVVSTSPSNGAVGIGITSAVTVTFSEAMAASTIAGNVTLAQGATPVPATVAYDAPARRATLTLASPLAYDTTYTATVKGGTGGVEDLAGNALAPDVNFTFTTRSAPTTRPDPNVGPGGPVLLVKGSEPFGSYLPEIVRAEGLNLFTTGGTGALTSSGLAPYTTVILGETTLTADQVTALTDWVNAGGNLVALRPDPALAGLLGLTVAGGTLSEGYIRVDTAASPGAGIVGETMQFHGTADQYPAVRDAGRGHALQQRNDGNAVPGGFAPQRGHRRRIGRRLHVRPRSLGRPNPPGQPGLGQHQRRRQRRAGAGRRPVPQRQRPRLGEPGQGRHPAGGRAAAPARQRPHRDHARRDAAAPLLVPAARRGGGPRDDGRRTRRGQRADASQQRDYCQPGRLLGRGLGLHPLDLVPLPHLSLDDAGAGQRLRGPRLRDRAPSEHGLRQLHADAIRRCPDHPAGRAGREVPRPRAVDHEP